VTAAAGAWAAGLGVAWPARRERCGRSSALMSDTAEHNINDITVQYKTDDMTKIMDHEMALEHIG